jgi:hypothetical protein
MMQRHFILMLGVALLFVSCSDGDKSLANKAGDKVGQVLTDFAGGMGKGIDKQMLVKVELSDELSKRGLTMSVSKQDSLAAKTVVLYLIASKNFNGKLLAKAINEQGLEIGRTTAFLKLGKDEAKYVSFKFHNEMDSQLVKSYQVSLL